MRYRTVIKAKVAGEAEALVGLVGGSINWDDEIGREHREDLAKIMVSFLLQYQPTQVMLAPREADAPVLDVFQLFGFRRLYYNTPEAKKTVSDFFYKWGQYSVEFNYKDFRDKVQSDPEEKHNVVEEYPEIANKLKAKIEALIGQPLPAVLPELCDRALSPIHEYWRRKYGLHMRRRIELHDIP